VYLNFFKELGVEEQNLLISNVVELYNQKEYISLYGLAGCWLRNFYHFSNSDEIKRRIIKIYFDKICYMSSSVVSIGDAKYYTNHAKDRLLEIVEKRWREEDLKAWTIFIEQNLDIDSYKKDVKRIMKETNKQGEDVENYLLDSLIHKGVEKNLQSNINRPINKWCVMIIGSLNDKRFVFALESIIEETKTHKDSSEYKEACTYALAKLGVQKYINEIFENDKDIKWRYLGTKEAYLRWLEVNFDWNKSSRANTASPYLPNPLVIMENIRFDIKNIPRELLLPLMEGEGYATFLLQMKKEGKMKDYDPFKDEENKEFIQKIYKLYQWIRDNPDKWELPPANDRF
jgi:hypothetical protein